MIENRCTVGIFIPKAEEKSGARVEHANWVTSAFGLILFKDKVFQVVQ